MRGAIKEYSLTVDYCAFMVAIVISCHKIDAANSNTQWSGEELAEKLNLSPQAQHSNFHVNPLALKQGLVLFQRYLHKWGVSTIVLHQEEKATVEYFNLGEMLRSVEVKFATYQSVGTERSNDDTLQLILTIRNKLLSLAGYEKSTHESACSVFGSLYLPLATNLSPIEATTKSTPASTVQYVTKQYKVRKSPSKLGKRAVYNSTKKVLTSAVKSFGDQNALFYLESAVKKLQKKEIVVNLKRNLKLKILMKIVRKSQTSQFSKTMIASLMQCLHLQLKM